MNHAKNFAAATLLVFALAVGCYAGDQHTPGYVDPPPPTSSTSMTVSSSTDVTTVSTDVTTTDVVTSDSLWLDVLTVLLSVY